MVAMVAVVTSPTTAGCRPRFCRSSDYLVFKHFTLWTVNFTMQTVNFTMYLVNFIALHSYGRENRHMAVEMLHGYAHAGFESVPGMATFLVYEWFPRICRYKQFRDSGRCRGASWSTWCDHGLRAPIAYGWPDGTCSRLRWQSSGSGRTPYRFGGDCQYDEKTPWHLKLLCSTRFGWFGASTSYYILTIMAAGTDGGKSKPQGSKFDLRMNLCPPTWF